MNLKETHEFTGTYRGYKIRVVKHGEMFTASWTNDVFQQDTPGISTLSRAKEILQTQIDVRELEKLSTAVSKAAPVNPKTVYTRLFRDGVVVAESESPFGYHTTGVALTDGQHTYNVQVEIR